MGRVLFDEGRVTSPLSSPTTTSLGLVQNFNDSRIQSYVLNYKRIFGASAVNDFRITYSRDAMTVADAVQEGMDALAFVPGRGFGVLAPGAVTGIQTNSSGPQFWRQNQFEYIDDAAVARGQHALKFGGIVKRLRYNSFNVGRLRGEYQFQTLQDLLLTRPNRFEAGHVTQGMRGMRQWLFGFYLQDDFRATSRLTFNLGLRYEFVTIVTEANGRIANLRNPLDPQVTVGDPWFRNPSLRNFAPRFGFAYDPGGNAKTAIRGGFGIYHDQLLSLYWRDSGNRILPWTRRLFITPSPATPVIPFPDAIRLFDLSRELLSDPTMFPELMPYDPSQPNTMQYNLTIQRQFLPTMSLMIGYLGSQSRHNSRNVQWNPSSPTAIINGEKFFAPNTPRRNPNFSSVLQREMDSNANYNSLQVVLKKRFSHNLNFDIVYQWGRIMDEMSGIAGSTDFANITSIAMDPDDRSRDYGRAAFDIRHYLTVNGTYEIPYGSLTGVVRQILGGWRLSSLFNYSSGEPFSVVNRFDRAGNNMLIYGFQERPNVAPGRSNNPIIGDPDRWFDTTAFELQPAGFFGNAGRNTLQGPNLITMDLAVLKTFPLGEARKVEFRWEMFNLMNRANFSQPTFTVFLNPTTRDPNAGRITSTRSSSRQMQFGLKFLF